MRRTGTSCLVGLPRSRPGPWYRDPALIFLGGLTAAMLTWFSLDVGGPSSQAVGCWAAVTVFDLCLAVTSHRVVRRLDRSDPAGRFWRTVRAASLVYSTGTAIQVAQTIADPSALSSLVGGAVSSAGLAMGTAMIVVVMLRYPLGLVSTLDRVCFLLDVLTVVAAVAAFGWYLGPAQVGVQPSTHVLSNLAVVLEGPVLLLVAGFAVARLMIAGTAPYCRAAGYFAAVTGAVGGTARGVGPVLAELGSANVFFALTVLAYALAPMGVVVQERHLRARPDRPRSTRRRPYSPVPYLAIAATYGLLLVALVRHEFDVRTWAVVGGAVGSTALVIARQLAAFADNARLLRELRTALLERDALADELRRQAFHDSLTGLPNRAAFTERLIAQFARARRHGWPVVVMLVDLDDFKPVNDRLGHHAGDLLLTEVAVRLRQGLREVDMVARYGGDEFAVVLAQLHVGSLVAVAERVLASLAAPCVILGEEVAMHASVGAAVDEGGAGDPEELLRNADAAMYAAKRQGKDTFAIFQPPVPVEDDASTGCAEDSLESRVEATA